MKVNDIVSPLGAAATDASAGPAAPRDEFLRLLVAQLEHQNPLDPESGADFVAQLAQFSSLEQVAETNQRLALIQAEQAAANDASLASFVGHEATVSGETLTIDRDRGAMPEVLVELDGPIASGNVVVYDSGGKEVQRIALGPGSEGALAIAWDGSDRSGAPLADGAYRVEIEASAADGTPVGGRPRLRGTVAALEFVNGQPRLRLGATTVAPSDVLSIR